MGLSLAPSSGRDYILAPELVSCLLCLYPPQLPLSAPHSPRVLLRNEAGSWLLFFGLTETGRRASSPWLYAKWDPWVRAILVGSGTGLVWVASFPTMWISKSLPLCHEDFRVSACWREERKGLGGEVSRVLWGEGTGFQPTLLAFGQLLAQCHWGMLLITQDLLSLQPLVPCPGPFDPSRWENSYFFGLRVTTREAKPMVGAPRGIQRSAHHPLWQVGQSWTWHEDRPHGASSWSTQPLARASGDQISKPGWFRLACTALGAELCPARSRQLGSCAGCEGARTALPWPPAAQRALLSGSPGSTS